MSTWSLTHADKSPWSLDGVRHLVYIDDVVFFGVDRAQVDRQKRAYTAVIKDSGLVVKRKKLVTATADPVKVLGFLVHGSAGTISIHEDTMSKLISRTKRVLNSDVVSGITMQRLLDHWIWALLPSRPVLSVLSNCFRFAECAQHLQFQLCHLLVANFGY